MRRILHHAVVVIVAMFAVHQAAGACSSWCNAYTGAMSSCSSCTVTTDVEEGKYCAGWCNSYTCGSLLGGISSPYCDGCTFWPCDPCNFNGTFAYNPREIPPKLLGIMSHDEDIIQPNGCNVCPVAGQQPVWISPGDLCWLAKDGDGFSTKQFDHCDNHTHWAVDFTPAHHVKACLTAKERDHLWLSGHCYNVTSTLPFVREEGLLFCAKAVTCQCMTPNTGTAGDNEYECTDGSKGYCASNEACVTPTDVSFTKSDWEDGAAGCSSSFTCHCKTPNKGAAGDNAYDCTDGSTGYCAPYEACVTPTDVSFTKSEWEDGAAGCSVPQNCYCIPIKVSIYKTKTLAHGTVTGWTLAGSYPGYVKCEGIGVDGNPMQPNFCARAITCSQEGVLCLGAFETCFLTDEPGVDRDEYKPLCAYDPIITFSLEQLWQWSVSGQFHGLSYLNTPKDWVKYSPYGKYESYSPDYYGSYSPDYSPDYYGPCACICLGPRCFEE